VTTPERNGWFFKSLGDFYTETGLSECEQQTARAQLTKVKILLYERRGIPPTTWYKIDLAVVVQAMKRFYETGELLIKRERAGNGQKNPIRDKGKFTKSKISPTCSSGRYSGEYS
jgi:hypothetical protein